MHALQYSTNDSFFCTKLKQILPVVPRSTRELAAEIDQLRRITLILRRSGEISQLRNGTEIYMYYGTRFYEFRRIPRLLVASPLTLVDIAEVSHCINVTINLDVAYYHFFPRLSSVIAVLQSQNDAQNLYEIDEQITRHRPTIRFSY